MVDNGSESPPYLILGERLRLSCVPRAMEANENTGEMISLRLSLATFFTSLPLKAPLQILAVKLRTQKTGQKIRLTKHSS